MDDFAHAAEEVDQQPQLVVVVVRDDLRLSGANGVVERVELVIGPGSRLHQHAAAVGGIGNPLDVTGLLEPIDHPGRRTGGQPGQLSQPADRQTSLCEEDVETFEVGAGQPQSFRDSMAKKGGPVASCARGAQDGGH